MKNLLLALLCVWPMLVFGQLNVQPDGKTVAGTADYSSSVTGRLNVFETTNAHGLRVKNTSTNANVTGITSSAASSNASSNFIIGMEGSASVNNQYGSGILIGVKGSTGWNTVGSSYGVYGMISQTMRGAGVIGVQPTTSYVYPVLTDRYAGYFYGNVAITGSLTVAGGSVVSDYRYKQNIEKIAQEKAVENLFKLNPVEYNLKQRYLSTLDSLGRPTKVGYFDEKSPMFQKKHYGLIAQEVQELYPDLVYEDSDGYLSVNYIGIIPLLIESVKDLKTEIEELKAINNTLQTTNLIEQNEQSAVLYQNTPNPFSQSTEIRYYLPASANNAYLCFYDLHGKQLKQIRLTQRGNGSQIISGSEFSAGIYLYALIVDNNEIDVKRMILME